MIKFFDVESMKNLWERNLANSHISLSKLQKAKLGIYLICRDWMNGQFPPHFEDRTAVWKNECNYSRSFSGITHDDVVILGNSKPFDLRTDEFEIHAKNFSRIRLILRSLKLEPASKILELGCGQGWLSEMLAMSGFNVTGTTIAPFEIEEATKRAAAFKLRSIPGSLEYAISPMEEISEKFSDQDCVIVYEALHHAFDWHQTVRSAAKALRSGGWFLICAEPNIAHTFISYRVSLLTKTHEIGISRRELKKELKLAGFSEIKTFSSPFHFWISWHWIAARI